MKTLYISALKHVVCKITEYEKFTIYLQRESKEFDFRIHMTITAECVFLAAICILNKVLVITARLEWHNCGLFPQNQICPGQESNMVTLV